MAGFPARWTRGRVSLLTFDRKGRLVYLPDAWLGADRQGRIGEVRSVTDRRRGAEAAPRILAIPGLVDAHCHLPQYPAVAAGADGLELLPWLERHIFPLERRFRGEAARPLARRFFGDLAAHGTTLAAVYTSVWQDSTDVCFQEAEASGLRVVMGKVMMDRGSYDVGFAAAHPGQSRTEVSLRQSMELCRKWHGRGEGRLQYAFTPRFALSCSEALLRGAAELAGRFGVCVQTHLAENRAEVAAVAEAFPRRRSYAEVYAACGLLGPRTVLAHCVWLSEREIRLIAESGAAAVHCPTSNAFLGSGIADLGALRRAGVPVGLGSDVAGGPSLDLFEVMRAAVYGQRLAAAHRLFRARPEPTAAKAFALATLGGARALGLDHLAGSLERRKSADFVLLDPAAYELGDVAGTAEEAVSRLVYRGGRHAVRAVYVAGRRVYP